MLDFLSFNKFITPYILIIFYYIGAILVPFILFYYRYKIFSKLKVNFGFKFWLIAILMFLCMEICWRVIFEFLIAYFDMHKYLYNIENRL